MPECLVSLRPVARTPDLLGLGEIAERYGIQKNSAWRWTKREDFPEPVMHVSGRIPVWKATDIERWARKHLPLRQGRPKRS